MYDRTTRARQLRSAPTDAERRLWRALRQRQPLVIEVDRAPHAEKRGYDAVRDRDLRSRGFPVLRSSDREVLSELDLVLSAARDTLHENPHPRPPPQAGEGIRRL